MIDKDVWGNITNTKYQSPGQIFMLVHNFNLSFNFNGYLIIFNLIKN